MIENYIKLKDLKLNNGRSIEGQLRYEQKRLLSLIQKHMSKWYDSYNPSVYERTFGMRAIYADEAIAVDVNAKKLTLTIKFTDAAYGKSLWSNEKINKIQLMNNGYTTNRNTFFSGIPYFGYREGGHFLESAIEEFNKANYLGFKVKIDFGQ